MKTITLTSWWRRNHREARFWTGFLGLLLLPTAISLAMGLMPLWVVAGTALAVLFVGGLFALTDRDATPHPRA